MNIVYENKLKKEERIMRTVQEDNAYSLELVRRYNNVGIPIGYVIYDRGVFSLTFSVSRVYDYIVDAIIDYEKQIQNYEEMIASLYELKESLSISKRDVVHQVDVCKTHYSSTGCCGKGCQGIASPGGERECTACIDTH